MMMMMMMMMMAGYPVHPYFLKAVTAGMDADADDTNIFYCCEDIQELSAIVNRELISVVQWFKSNRLSVNLKKTNFIIFGTGNRKKINKIKNFEILLDNMKISRTETAKFLGTVIDENLSWKQHINYIKNKIAKSIGIIKRLRYCLAEHTLNTLYKHLSASVSQLLQYYLGK